MAAARPPLSLKGRALALLAQREHSVAELRRKLLRHAQAAARAAAREGPADASARARARSDAAEEATSEPVDPAAAREAAVAQIDALIDWLRAHRYLSEERFVESRVHARAGRYGNLRIRQELAQHGVPLPAELAQSLKDSELARATEVWRRKFGTAASDAGERARQMRFLAQRGFSQETIARVMRQARG